MKYSNVPSIKTGFREKMPLEVYQNSCARNKVPVRRTVEQALRNNVQMDALVLADTCRLRRIIAMINICLNETEGREN